LHEGGRELVARRERRPVHDEIQRAELRANSIEQLGNLAVTADITRQHQRPIELAGQIADVLLEALTLIRQRQPCATSSHRFRDRPRDRAFVSDTDDESVRSREISHGVRLALGRF
jgi:hypothetical protein